MNKSIATAAAAFAAAAVLTAAPANAKALRDPELQATPSAPCARIVMSDQGDCAVHVTCKRVKVKRHHHAGHRRVRVCWSE